MSDALLQRIAQAAPLAHAICRAMQEEGMRLGLWNVQVDDPAKAVYRLSMGPASGQDSLMGEWREPGGPERRGYILNVAQTLVAAVMPCRP